MRLSAGRTVASRNPPASSPRLEQPRRTHGVARPLDPALASSVDSLSAAAARAVARDTSSLAAVPPGALSNGSYPAEHSSNGRYGQNLQSSMEERQDSPTQQQEASLQRQHVASDSHTRQPLTGSSGKGNELAESQKLHSRKEKDTDAAPARANGARSKQQSMASTAAAHLMYLTHPGWMCG